MAGEDLQTCPPTWSHRRELLAYIDNVQAQRDNDTLAVAALSDMLMPYSAGATDVHTLVAHMHRAREIRQTVMESMHEQAGVHANGDLL